MQKKLEDRAFEQVAPILHHGEQPLVATRALVGKFTGSRLGAIASQTLVMEGGGALLGSVLTRHRKQFVVLTSYRLIFMTQTFMGGPGKTFLGEVPRPQVGLAEVKMGIVSLVRVAFGNRGDGVALTFPRSDKKNAEALATALQQSSR